MSEWIEQIEQTIAEKKLFRRRETILVGVSGGVDSMVLLHLLDALAKRWGWKLVVAHFNHQLRGRASETDETFVRSIAAKMKLPFVADRHDVKVFAMKNALSIEMAARQLRHEFFAKTARRRTIQTIALAHHADDQIELFFLRLLRGAGGEGLAGMKWQNRSPGDASIRLVRPLLDQSKSDLARYATENNIAFREDASNASLKYQRNRIRHELLPLLRKLQPSFEKTVLRAMKLVGAESVLAEKLATDWIKDKKPGQFKNLPPALQRQVLKQQLMKQSLPIDFDLIEKLRTSPDTLFTIAPGRQILMERAGGLRLHTTATPVFQSQKMIVDLSAGYGKILFDGRSIDWQIETGGMTRFERRREFFDADQIGDKIALRHWQPGDRFQPIGMSRPKKLQDLFVDLKVPRAERQARLIATTGRGEIFWVENLRISERFKLDNRTVRRLKWTYE